MPYAKLEDKREHDKKYIQTWREENPRRVLSYRIQRQYNMALEQYDKLLEEQNYGCAICGTTKTYGKANKETPFFVDHDHSCCPGANSCGSCVRGLLCMMCNSALGMLKDSPEIIASALRYVSKENNCV
jgi:hypothetical protein